MDVFKVYMTNQDKHEDLLRKEKQIDNPGCPDLALNSSVQIGPK